MLYASVMAVLPAAMATNRRNDRIVLRRVVREPLCHRESDA